jgi:hypothetical protein
MEVEEEFLHNATSMARYAEEEIKQFITWTGKRSPYNRTAEEIKAKLQTIVDDIKLLKKDYVDIATTNSVLRHPSTSS